MPYYDYKCECGDITTIFEKYEDKKHYRDLYCGKCQKWTEHRWQFPLSRFHFGVFESEVKNG